MFQFLTGKIQTFVKIVVFGDFFPVSIPYRLRYKHVSAQATCLGVPEFQFLTGKIQTIFDFSSLSLTSVFQLLTGKIQTTITCASYTICHDVLIPYR